MTPTSTQSGLTSELIERVQNLTHAEKAQLVGLMFNDEPDDDSEEVTKAWKAEIARRVEGYLSGTISSSDWRESVARVEQTVREEFPS